MVCDTEWPKANKAFLSCEEVVVGVQVNGKLRGKIKYDKSISSDDIKSLALSLDTVKRFLNGKQPIKIIVVPELSLIHI